MPRRPLHPETREALRGALQELTRAVREARQFLASRRAELTTAQSRFAASQHAFQELCARQQAVKADLRA